LGGYCDKSQGGLGPSKGDIGAVECTHLYRARVAESSKGMDEATGICFEQKFGVKL